jgi:hypothetical protein
MSTPTPPPTSPTPPSSQPGQVIWQRTIDHDRQRRRTRWLIWFAIAAAGVAALVAALVDPGSALGVVLIAGFLGAIASVFVFGAGAQARAGKTITVQDTSLVCGRVTVPIGEVTAYTTYSGEEVAGVANGKSVKVRFGFAVFQLADGSTRAFKWPKMPEDQVDGVRVALDTVLPGRWQPHAAT